MNRSTKKIVFSTIALILLIIVLNLASSSFYSVNENEYACVIRFSKIIKTESAAGLYVKIPFIDSVRYYPKTSLFYDLKPSDVFTSDSKAMSVDSFIIWKITDPLKFFQTLKTVNGAENRLDSITYNVLKKVVGTMKQEDIVSSADEKSREYLNNSIYEQVKLETPKYGIETIGINVKRFELPTDNEQSVYRRMIADRNKNAELYRAEGIQDATIIRNEVDKTVNIIVSNAEATAEKIKAEGEAEYMRILAEAYNTDEKKDFYVFLRGLDALRESLKGGNKTIILDGDSELAKLLTSPD